MGCRTVILPREPNPSLAKQAAYLELKQVRKDSQVSKNDVVFKNEGQVTYEPNYREIPVVFYAEGYSAVIGFKCPTAKPYIITAIEAFFFFFTVCL